MTPRPIDYAVIKPEFIGKLRAMTRELESFALGPDLRALVETRVSQINRCAFCIDRHSREALACGVTRARLEALPEWRTSPLYREREKAALDWAESMTRVSTLHPDEGVYARLFEHFPETEIVELSLCVALANFWNRMASGFRKAPESVPPRP